MRGTGPSGDASRGGPVLLAEPAGFVKLGGIGAGGERVVPMKTFFFALAWTAAFLIPWAFAGGGEEAGPGKWFRWDASLRVDYFHGGNGKEEWICPDSLWMQGPWAGPRSRLVDPLDLGGYRVEVRDPSSGELLFSRGFDSIFGEYKTTGEAGKGKVRVFRESCLLPMPKRPLSFRVLALDPGGKARSLLQVLLDPRDERIHREKPGMGVISFQVHRAGPPWKCLDLAFLGEGYTRGQEKKFRRDVERFTGYLFTQRPFSRFRDRINVWGAFRPSLEEGCDEPDRGVWRHTSLEATHCAFGLPRYCLTFRNRAVQETAAAVPHDTLAIVVNKKRYGGGGIYNLYCIFAADGPDPDRVFLHELGHSFGGLGDEYYSARVAYNDFYPPGVEPRVPNLTALLDPARLKWKDLVEPGTPIPTPWGKEAYERLQEKFRGRERALQAQAGRAAPGKERERLRRELAALKKAHKEALRKFLERSPYWNKIGAFEGGGYASKGLYRPSLHCLMFAFSPEERSYCKVCERAIARRIELFLE